jgi:DNA (cytosine-5)-methyltransferase 1
VSRPRLLDLFCGAGGAAAGYARAGFEVVGVDLVDQPRYPFEFHRADALEFPLDGFDAIHASPPCQRYSAITRVAGRSGDHPDLVDPIRTRLLATGLPYVIENVEGAPLRDAFLLCGSSFGLAVRRHRRFELLDPPLLVPPCQHDGPALQVNGHPGGSSRRDPRMRFGSVAEWRVGMGVDWMTGPELAEAIPPAYTEWVGSRLLEGLR